MATQAEIMDALADQISDYLATVTDVTIHVEGRAFKVAEVPAVDMFTTAPNGLEQGLVSFGPLLGFVPLNIRVRVSPADIEAGENLFLALTDDEDELSIVAAIASDTTLGGLVSEIAWGDWSGYTDFPDVNGDGMFLGSLLPVVVAKAYS